MIITRLETFTKPFMALVRVTLEDGTTGWGQMSPHQAEISTTVFHELVAPLAIGRDASDIAEVVDFIFGTQLKFPGTFMCRAMAGLDTALHDAHGQLRGLPVFRLLGGTSNRVRVYASSMSRAVTAEEEVDRFRRLRDGFGFDAFKFRVGEKWGRNGDVWPGRTEQIAIAMGRAFGSEGLTLLADGNSCYDVAHALKVGRLLSDSGVSCFEEPCPYWKYDWTREVRDTLDIKVSGGEQDNYLPAWDYMMASRVVDIAQPDLCYVGGVVRALQVAEIAERHDTPVVFHAANPTLVTLFSLHVMSALPNAGPFCEFCIEEAESYEAGLGSLFAPGYRVEDGAVTLSDEPGWGVRINPDWLEGASYRMLDQEVG